MYKWRSSARSEILGTGSGQRYYYCKTTIILALLRIDEIINNHNGKTTIILALLRINEMIIYSTWNLQHVFSNHILIIKII